MRTVPAASTAASPLPLPAGNRDVSATAVVCSALALALVFLAFRIASVW